ncbi:peptidylprolyl isomerase [Corticicoccus populi]|uniref:peptidylprolyl isomerase n=1 Tax=Corticicoccus populi TaxID=1812821 RepID=A0ABW5WSK2_9STAP
MKKKLAPLLVSLGIIGLAGCSNDGEEAENTTSEGDVDFGEVLASSDAGDVTADDILNQMGTQQVATQTFQLTLDKVLMDKYSEELNQEDLQAEIDQEIEEMGGEEQVAMMLQQQQSNVDVESYKQQRLIAQYHDRYFIDEFDITDEEAKESVREGSHILVSVTEDGEEAPEGEEALTDEEAREKAEDLIQQLEDGADFAELATAESDDPGSAANNGSLGYVQRGQMVEPFENALFELEPGEMTTEPVKSDFGYHIILRGEEENIDDELSSVKRQIVNQRVQESPDEVLTMYQSLLDEYNVEFENEDIRTFIEDTYLQDEAAVDTEENPEDELGEE